jgi:predicted nuclease with TOPRIM domain
MMTDKCVDRKARETATLAQTLKIADLVKEHCRLNDAGYAEWDEGWSDESVAAAVGMTSDARTKKIRLELVGDLMGRTSKTSAQRKLEERIEHLDGEVAGLRSRVEELENRHKVLVAFANKMQNGSKV